MKVTVVSGDIAQVKADALISAINSEGMWFGGIDRVIQRHAGGLFHEQAGANMPLKDGQAIVAKGGPRNRSKFENVIFVVDDLRQPLRAIIFAGLAAAANEGYKTVALPAIRLGVMRGVVEKTPGEAIDEIDAGVRQFFAQHGQQAMNITFVIYEDRDVEMALREKLQSN